MPITYTEALPESCALAALLDTTGWFRDALLTVDAVDAALAGSWTALSAYDGDLLDGAALPMIRIPRTSRLLQEAHCEP
jgi:hypothetical protein